MPQTREHLDICRLLGVSRGVVVVTKSDLLPGLGADWLPLLEEEMRAACAGTFLESAAIVRSRPGPARGYPCWWRPSPRSQPRFRNGPPMVRCSSPWTGPSR